MRKGVMILDIFEGPKFIGTFVAHRDTIEDLNVRDYQQVKALCFWDKDDGEGLPQICYLCGYPKDTGWMYMQSDWTSFACVGCVIGN